jgi:hypothetical protein
MTEQWLIQDIKQLMQYRNRVVLLDPSGKCSFLLAILQQYPFVVLQTDSTKTEPWQMEQEELLMRHEAETLYRVQAVVFFVNRQQEKLSFLFDYCHTHGCLDLQHPQEWLKRKIFTHTGLQVQLDNPALLTAAKMGLGKDLNWWKKIVQNLEEVIDLDAALLPFLQDPDGYLSDKEPDIRRLFEEKLHALLAQPYTSKPPKTLADQLVKRMLDGLANNEIPDVLLNLYYRWADSDANRPSLVNYIYHYRIDHHINPWAAHPDHCFIQIDEMAIRQLSQNIRDAAFVKERLQKLNNRIFHTKAPYFVPSWWKDLYTLLHVDTQPLSGCSNLSACIDYYTQVFSKADRAIRNLYEAFLQDEAIIRPLQEFYESQNQLLLQTWFGFHADYQSNQQDFLPKLFATAKPKTAVIVGDGVRYEIADQIAAALQKQYKVEKQVMLADMPSETEHNMSALYVGNKRVLPLHKDREASLLAISGKPIEFLPLEQVNYGMTADYLVLTYKDIDSAGEKLQQAAIKLFAEFEQVLVEKISLLLNIGYQDVYLVTDHGFVLTGLLDEADKIDPVATGKKEVHERYIRTVEKQSNSEWISFEEPYAEYKYIQVAKNHRPFKSRGVYGFSHGGFTPQEIIIPNFKFSRKQSVGAQLEVVISNKTELNEVTGELFVVRMATVQAPGGLFGGIRKLQVKLYAGQSEYQSSDIFQIEVNSQMQKEFSFSGNTTVQAVLLDAHTQEQLDSVIINKLNLRDMGGLL